MSCPCEKDKNTRAMQRFKSDWDANHKGGFDGVRVIHEPDMGRWPNTDDFETITSLITEHMKGAPPVGGKTRGWKSFLPRVRHLYRRIISSALRMTVCHCRLQKNDHGDVENSTKSCFTA